MSLNGLDGLAHLALDSSLRAIALAGMVAALLAALRIPRGATRHAAWTGVLAIMLLMPALTQISPRLEVPLPWPVQSGAQSAEGIQPSRIPMAAVPDAAPTSTARPITTATSVTPALPAALPTQTPPPTASGVPWQIIAVAGYAIVSLLLLGRMAVGWMMASRLIRASQRCHSPAAYTQGLTVLESPQVATPLTVGVFRPAIILPTAWHSWPPATLRAVLAHEAGHVRRRDSVVAALARLNCIVFWFNPLAWWLERIIARNAEAACDSGAAGEAGSPQQYAQVLVEMSEAVRTRRGRVAWHGIGVHGSGSLEQRIGGILGGHVFREVSVLRKMMVGFVGVLTVALAVACQAPKPAPKPLEPDPEVTARRERDATRDKAFEATRAMTVAQVAELEAAIAKDPANRDAREKLLTFYFSADFKHEVVTWSDKLAARRRHVLWLIANDPGGNLLGGARKINSEQDPTGYAQAKALWMAATSKKDVDRAVLRNAANFFELNDDTLVERLLLQAEAADPGGPQQQEVDVAWYPKWVRWLGSHYGNSIIRAARGEKRLGPSGATPVTDADRAFARHARQTLDASSDANLLLGAGSTLGRSMLSRPGSPADPPSQTDTDLSQLGVAYLRRAGQITPKLTSARRELLTISQMERSRAFWVLMKNTADAQREDVVRGLPEAQRLRALADLAGWLQSEARAIGGGWARTETLPIKLKKADPAAAKALFGRAKTAAEEALRMADSRPSDPERGTAMAKAHLTLSAIALHDNDLAGALKHLDAAGTVPPSEELKYGTGFEWQNLAVGLLKSGERESVARFLDRLSAMNDPPDKWLAKSASQIRAGQMPSFYQYQTMSR